MKNLNEYISNDMKSFKTSLIESLLDDEDEILATSDEIIIKSEIMKFLHENYFGAKKCTISDKRDVDGKYVVNSTISLMPSKNLDALTNGMFKFGKIGYDFMCHECSSLTSLEGAPQEVKGGFYCYKCENLTSLEGAPKKVGGEFDCHGCKNLTSLVGVPKKIKKDFDCSDCTSLKSLAGAPEHVGGHFYCDHCTSLNSLEGLPKKISGNFYCNDCAVKFDRNEIINKCCISGYEITT